MTELRLVLKDRLVRTYPLNSPVITIGRGGKNDIVLDNLALSRRHAQLERKTDGRWYISDLGSQNGVVVNEVVIDKARALGEGDRITLGKFEFVFSQSGSEAPKSLVRPQLLLHYADMELQRYVLDRPMVVGRSTEADIVVSDHRLSRQHCEITPHEDGTIAVRDLSSQNGTWVNGVRLDGERSLGDGDMINLWEFTLRFVVTLDESTEAAVGSPPGGDEGGAGAAAAAGPAPGADFAVGEPSIVLVSGMSKEFRADLEPGQSANLRVPPGRGPGTLIAEPIEPDVELAGRPRGPSALSSTRSAVELQAAQQKGLGSSFSGFFDHMTVDRQQMADALARHQKPEERGFGVDVVVGGRVVRRVSMSQMVVSIGGDARCDVRLGGGKTSPLAAVLAKVFDSLVFIRLGSGHAALINGEPKLQAFLKEGDEVRIENVTLRVSMD